MRKYDNTFLKRFCVNRQTLLKIRDIYFHFLIISTFEYNLSQKKKKLLNIMIIMFNMFPFDNQT